ncbi:MAG: hypothetical protein JXA30_03515 [Deltaproteobacteria bacterium]|nr:hypothetical protein [Deltaproteobacteria bacterium]
MPKRTYWVIAAGLVVLLSTTTREARAQSIGAELGFFTDSYEGEGSWITLSPLFDLEIPISDEWALAVEWGFFFSDLNDDDASGEEDDSTFRTGNPFLGAVYSIMDNGIDLKVGCGLGLPLASHSAGGEMFPFVASMQAIGIRGMWNLWLWRSRTLGIVFPLQLILDELPLFNIRGEAAAAGLISVSDDESEDSDILFQLAGEAGLRLGIAELGARLQLVWLPTWDGDNAQTAVEPYVLFDLRPGFVRFGLMMNLDKPLGFAFDSDGYWGVRLGVGFEF